MSLSGNTETQIKALGVMCFVMLSASLFKRDSTTFQFKNKHEKREEKAVYLFLLMLPVSDDRMLSPSSSSLLRSSLFFAFTNRRINRQVDTSVDNYTHRDISTRCFMVRFKLRLISFILGLTGVQTSSSIT